MKKNRRTFFVLLLAALLLLTAPLTVLASGSKHDQTTGQPVTDTSEPAKYVFVFIGDGMGLPQISAAERYLSAIEGQVTGSKKLTISTLPAQRITTTNAADRFITGSAASAAG